MEHQTLKIGQELKDLEIVSDEKEEIQPKKKIGRPVKYTDEQRKKLKNEKRKKKFEDNPDYAKKQNENIRKWHAEHKEQMEKNYKEWYAKNKEDIKRKRKERYEMSKLEKMQFTQLKKMLELVKII